MSDRKLLSAKVTCEPDTDSEDMDSYVATLEYQWEGLPKPKPMRDYVRADWSDDDVRAHFRKLESFPEDAKIEVVWI